MVSIHAPREGSDPVGEYTDIPPNAFQSTLPVKGATLRDSGEVSFKAFQSTLPVKGATNSFPPMVASIPSFQSTLPVKGATAGRVRDHANRAVSIHAPREGSDLDGSPIGVAALRVSIHAPREGSDPR